MNIKILSLMLLLCLCSLVLLCQNTELKVVDTAGCNLAINEKISDSEYSLVSTSKAPNWFSCAFTNIDISKELTFSLCMNDNDAVGAAGDVSKWDGLWPVYTYSEYLNYDTYIYYTKNDDGYWVSSDVFAKEKLTGNGKTPEQTVIPVELAEEFLSEDGKYWSAWAELQDTHADKGSNTFFMTHQFNSPNVSIAMKYPYCYDYELEYMTRLEKANIPGIKINNIGKSIKDHNLYVVEINDPTATAEELKERRVVLIYANEDGDEADSSWVVDGAISYLAKGLLNNDEAVKKILNEVTFLFIPLLDPVGWEECTYGNITKSFNPNDYETTIRDEILYYASFINDRCGQDYNLDVIINLHNVECNEGVNLFSPLIDIKYTDDIFSANSFALSKFSNIKTSMMYWDVGFVKNRFFGWCSNLWGGLTLLYEINSRYPDNRLNIEDMHDMSREFVLIFDEYLKTENFEYIYPKIAYQQAKQLKEYLHFHDKMKIPEHLKAYYTLRKGF